MMKTLIYLTGILIAVMLFTLCKDIIDEDISNMEVVLIAPSDSVVTGIYNQNFTWEEISEAAYYNIQIVTPSFGYIEKFVADSIVEDNWFSISLDSGSYQWRVIAENNAGKAYSKVFRLYITGGDSTGSNDADISSATISGLNPGQVTREENIVFNWNPVTGARYYILLIKKSSWSLGTLFDSSIVSTAHKLYNQMPEGSYVWGVKAFNNASVMNHFDTTSFTIDYTPPAIVNLVQPADGDTIKQISVSFTWKHQTDNGTRVFDSVYVYSDSVLSSLFARVPSSNDSTAVVNFNNDGVYYWRVKAYDMAGNKGDFSLSRKLIVNHN